MSYDDWKKERLAAWDKKSTWSNLRNQSYESSRMSDDLYYNLGTYIDERQNAAIPVAGEGGMEFLRALSVVSRWGSRLYPPLRIATITIDVVITTAEIEGY